MIRILSYTLTLLCISILPVAAQEKAASWRYEGPRVGFDLSRLVVPSFQKANRSAWEVQADLPYKGNWFPTVELGHQRYDDIKTNFHYLNSGSYGRVGIDMNIVKFESLSDHDFAFLGFRYGYSRFNQQADGINYSNYWGTLSGSVPLQAMNAHWAELVFGMKGEVIRNFFVGWSLRAKVPLVVTSDDRLKPYVIPGIGRMLGGTPVDFSFGVYYRFPIHKTKKLPPPLKMGGPKHPNLDREDNQNSSGFGGSQMGGGGLRSFRGGGQQ